MDRFKIIPRDNVSSLDSRDTSPTHRHTARMLTRCVNKPEELYKTILINYFSRVTKGRRYETTSKLITSHEQES